MNNKLLAASTAFLLLVSATGCGNAGNATGNAAGLAGNAVTGVGNATGNAVGWTGRTVGNAVGGVGNAVGWTGRTAGNVVGGAGRATGNVVGGVGNAAGNVVGGLGRATGNVVGGIGAAVGGAGAAAGNAIGGTGRAGGNAVGWPGDGTANGNHAGATAANADTTTTQTLQFNNANRIVDLRIDGGTSAAYTNNGTRGAGVGAHAGTIHRGVGTATVGPGVNNGTAATNDIAGNTNAMTLTVPVGWMVRVSTPVSANHSVTILPHFYTYPNNAPTNRNTTGATNRAGADVGGTVFGARTGPTANRYNGGMGAAGTYAGTPGAYGGTTRAETNTTNPGTYTADHNGIVRDHRANNGTATNAANANGTTAAGAGASAAAISGAHTGTVVTTGGRRQATFTGTTPGLYAVVLGGTTNGRVIAYINVSNSIKTPSVVSFHS